MTVSHTRPSTLELELYRDGELAEHRREEISELLRADPALRDCLASVARTDACAKEAFLAVESPGRSGVRPAVWRMVAAVGALSAMAAVVISVAVPEKLPRGESVAPLAALAPDRTAERGYQVAFSVPVKARAGDGKTSSKVAPVAELLDRALADGQGDEAKSLLVGADRAGREAAYRSMGEAIRTAEAARVAIAGLSDQEKLEVCRVWVEDPRLVAVAFTVLNELSGNAEVADEYRQVVLQLRADPKLRGYVLSYLPRSGVSGS